MVGPEPSPRIEDPDPWQPAAPDPVILAPPEEQPWGADTPRWGETAGNQPLGHRGGLFTDMLPGLFGRPPEPQAVASPSDLFAGLFDDGPSAPAEMHDVGSGGRRFESAPPASEPRPHTDGGFLGRFLRDAGVLDWGWVKKLQHSGGTDPSRGPD